MEEKEEKLARLHEDVNLCKDYLSTVRQEIMDQDISNYPIFIASEDPVELGRQILNKNEIDISWSFYASHLEEFAIKEIITEDKVDEFRELYKSHDRDFCLFVVMGDEYNFVFLPRITN